mgnify:CR=1 FL=1|tara:strand:- start:527 stop:2176 length:1650 start_codon:yes stop_codon:yes gene_type:complete
MPTLNFKGKPFVYSHHLSVPFRELKIDAEKSLPGEGGPSLDDNLIIHGDNLHALKALLPKYAGRVDVIYIDPPYNTGNEGWAYNDNVSSPLMKEWLGKVVDGEDLERHDKWLCMMWPRLILLRELLAETGIIFVSIDDNENHYLRAILDEIFNENNFVADIVWRSSDSANNDAKQVSLDHNYTLAYSKNSGWTSNLLERSEKQNAHYSNPDNDPHGPWFSGNLSSPNPRENLKYYIKHPDGRELAPPPNGWRWKKSEVTKKIKTGEIIFTETDRGILRKTYLKNQKGLAPSSLWIDLEETGHNRNAKYELKKIFPDIPTSELFKTPKPTKFLNKVMRISGNKKSIVLDSFAGSGTTAHAVQALNANDGGNRKFILVETEDYADTITAERVRRVMGGVPNAKNETLKNGLGGSFTYCDLGDPIDMDSFFDESASMPAYDQLASYIAYTATGEALDKAPKKPSQDWFIGEVGGVRIYLVYKPDSAFMKSHDAALDMETVKTISAGNITGKPSYVFAAAKYMSQSELTRDYDMTFCQLPYAIHRIMGDGVDE